MIDRIINTNNVTEANAILLSAPYEHGVSFMGGTAKGPEKIVEVLDNNLELFDRKLLTEPAKKIKTAHKKIENLEEASPEEVVNIIQTEYSSLNKENNLILTLGGEHSVTLGALKSIAEKENPEDITILQIDAHQDFRDDNSDYSDDVSKYAHSCVMRRAHEMGFKFVQVGIRTYSKYEYEYWQNNKNTITVFEWDGSKIPSIKKILKSIKTKKIYLSIDVDGFDPAHMPGTGTPVQGGLEWNYGLDLIQQAIEKKELVGADIVEVSPQEGSVITEFGAALLAYKIISTKFLPLLASR